MRTTPTSGINNRPGLTVTVLPKAPPTVPPPADGSVAPPAKRPGKDPRLTALRRFAMSITLFNVAGHLVLGFEQAPITPIACVVFAYLFDLVLETLDAWARGQPPAYRGGFTIMFNFLLPAHISALACAMLLYGNASLWPYLFAVAVALGSKYVIRLKVNGRSRHVLNPSNAGIAATLLLFPWVGISPPYHFTNNIDGPLDWAVPLGVLTLGTMLNVKLTRKYPLILAWVGGFIAQAVLRWAFGGEALGSALLPLTGLAFILFTNYMITDPATTPFRPRGQIIFGLTTAAVYGLLVLVHVSFGLFFALTITCALRGAIILMAPLTRRQIERIRGPGSLPQAIPTPTTGLAMQGSPGDA